MRPPRLNRTEHAFRLLNMSSIQPASDLTTRARIRDAAIEVFVREGFSASVRAVAAHAGVSPGLVIHHFASRAGLRAECDARVLELSRTRTDHVLGTDQNPSSTGDVGDAVTETLRSLAESGPLLVYITRLVTEGGETARTFVDHLVRDVETSMTSAVAAGTVRPSVDEPARARYLVAMSLGVLMIDLAMNPPPDPTDGAAILHEYVNRTMVPATEYATHGLLTGTSALDAVLAVHQGDPSGENGVD